jgi:hypothetical protein
MFFGIIAYPSRSDRRRELGTVDYHHACLVSRRRQEARPQQRNSAKPITVPKSLARMLHVFKEGFLELA